MDPGKQVRWTAPAVQYGVAVASVCAIAALRIVLTPYLGDRGQHLLFVPAVLFTALYGGFRPGLLAVALSAMLSVAVLNEPRELLSDPGQQLALGLYLVVCTAVLMLSHREREQKRRRTRAEKELAILNRDLEARVRERTAQLEAANKELRDFCYSVSHDLRTPMRAIAGNARILVEDHAQALTPELRERLDRIEMAAIKLGNLVEGLLTYARLASQELDREKLNLAEYAKDAAKNAGREQGCAVELEVKPEVWANADHRMIRVAMNELVKNAVLYRKPGEEACLELGETRENGKTTYFLRDSGIGFDLVYTDKVFKPFERLHRDEDYLGVGMGLAQVKRIIERHGGEISVDSKLGVGSCFSFTLEPPNIFA